MSQYNYPLLIGFDTVATVVFFLGLTMVMGLIAHQIWFCRIVKRRIAEWAEENDLQLLGIHSKMGPGPIKNRIHMRGVYYFMFTMVDRKGTEAAGWVRWNMWNDNWDPPSIEWTPEPIR